MTLKVTQLCLDSLQPHGLIQSMEFSSPEYWSGWPFPPPADLLNPGIELGSPALQVDSLPAELPGKPLVLFSSVQSLSHVQLFATPWT